MPHLTQSEWLAQLNECGGDLSQEDVINLVYKDGPNALWTDTVFQNHMLNQYSLYRYLTTFFSHRVWEDWKGEQELGRVYHAAHLPFDFSVFQRSMQICSPASLNECHTDYCEIPQGGISAIPQLEMWKTGMKTKPMCIANIRTSQQAKEIAKFIVDERFQVDEHVMNIFYTLALIRMLGHKWVLEYTQDANGNIIPVPSANPYNALGGFRYNYMNPLFPQAGNLNNVMPFTFDALDRFGRGLVNSRNPNFVARGPRGEPIFELWHPEDWYRQEVLDNPEYIERCKYFMKSELLPGYTLEGGEQEIVGNFKMKLVPNLPKFTESTDGGLTVVQPLRSVDVDSGTRAIHNFAEWDNAPFLLVIAVSNQIGEILTRPALTTGIEGMPILPINGGNSEWQYRNDYDKECNEDLNKPHFRKRYEMGFRMKNPDAGWGFLSRAKNFRLKPINTCDLRPIFKINPASQDCSILTIGCNPNNDLADRNILESGERRVKCGGTVCGKPEIWRLEVRHENQDSIAPGQSPIGPCECGDDINVYINNAAGVNVGTAQATVIEIFRPTVVNPNWSALVELAAPLSDGQCIGAIACTDGVDEVTIVHCNAGAANQIKAILSGPLECGVGDTVVFTYYDAEGETVGEAITAINVVSYDPETGVYVFGKSAITCALPEGACKVVVTCTPEG